MSCVFTTVVILYSRVISLISLSITKDVCGSSPELGSSQKRYFGFKTMALAIPTLFFIPPLSSAGNFLLVSFKFTRSRTSLTRSIFFLVGHGVNIFKGNITFSCTVKLSNNAELWKSIPICLRISVFSFRFIFVKLSPLYNLSPSSGSNNPTMHFIKTVFPLPLVPIIRLHCPAFITALTSCLLYTSDAADERSSVYLGG